MLSIWLIKIKIQNELFWFYCEIFLFDSQRFEKYLQIYLFNWHNIIKNKIKMSDKIL